MKDLVGGKGQPVANCSKHVQPAGGTLDRKSPNAACSWVLELEVCELVQEVLCACAMALNPEATCLHIWLMPLGLQLTASQPWPPCLCCVV